MNFNLLIIASGLPSVLVKNDVQVNNYLHKLGNPCKYGQLIFLSFLLSTVTLCLFFLFFSLMQVELQTLLLLSVASFLISFYYAYTLPKRTYATQLQQIQAELSTVLRSISTDLACGLNFET